jgi:uncharacterized membrane protein YvbJ
MFCQNCGEKIEDGSKVCPYCGYTIGINNELAQKEHQIEILQEKVIQLEQTVRNTTVDDKNHGFNNKMMFVFIFVFPIAFLIFFFVLFFTLANR